jgi:hypothetical protein
MTYLAEQIVMLVRRAEKAEAEVAGCKEVIADMHRLTRELDVALHGEEGAARQASLCDLITPARNLRAEVERLRAVIAPFAKLGRGIPDNWPDYCPLRIDSGPNRDGRMYEWISYHGVGDDGKTLDCDALLPTIGEWQAAAEAAGENP